MCRGSGSTCTQNPPRDRSLPSSPSTEVPVREPPTAPARGRGELPQQHPLSPSPPQLHEKGQRKGNQHKHIVPPGPDKIQPAEPAQRRTPARLGIPGTPGRPAGSRAWAGGDCASPSWQSSSPSARAPGWVCRSCPEALARERHLYAEMGEKEKEPVTSFAALRTSPVKH